MEIPALATNDSQYIGTFRKSKTSRATQWAASVLIAVIFSAAAFAKSRSFGEFEATLKASHLVPIVALSVVASVIIALEFSIALGILTPLLQPALRRVCLHLASLLSCTFISYSVWRLHEGIAVPCHCFGVLFRLSPLGSILLNIFLLAMILYVLRVEDATVNPKQSILQKEVK